LFTDVQTPCWFSIPEELGAFFMQLSFLIALDFPLPQKMATQKIQFLESIFRNDFVVEPFIEINELQKL
jgi:hypothetical protein